MDSASNSALNRSAHCGCIWRATSPMARTASGARQMFFSADTANPYEVGSIKGIVANLICNPGIIYDLFINDPKANACHRFNTRDELMGELEKILGPGCDISVELNNPFAESEQELLDVPYHFREMLSEYRVVIKVPHTGPVNPENME